VEVQIRPVPYGLENALPFEEASPVQLFCHLLDLAHVRYNGRPAPIAPGADAGSAEAYSHEVIAFGFWPGDSALTRTPRSTRTRCLSRTA
jgi:hypothetical protein